MQDVLAVLDAAGAERPAVYGDLEGAALSALFAATHPERPPGPGPVRAPGQGHRHRRLPLGVGARAATHVR